MHLRLAGSVLFALIALTACGSTESNVRVWQTADGDPVPPRLIEMRRGAEHCDWQNVWFLTTRNPGDTELEPVTQNTRQFILDRHGAFRSDALKSTYEANVEMPSDARFTGYVSEGAELWVSESQLNEAVFLVGVNGNERLPLADPPIYCD